MKRISGCYVVFHKQLGDLVLMEPTLTRLRDYYGAPVRLMTRSGHQPLLELMDGVVYQKGCPTRWKKYLYCYDSTKKSALRSFFAPVSQRIFILRTKNERRWFHSLFRVTIPELRDQYVAEYFWENTRVSSGGKFRTPQLKLPPFSWRPEKMREEPFVLVNPTGGWLIKNWLVERWVETLRAFYDRYSIPLIMTSGPDDWQTFHCQQIAEKLGGSIVQRLEGTSLRNFLWLCSRARLVLTIDGAASHLAQAFSRPSVTLFGPTSLANWHRPSKDNVAVQAAADKEGNRHMRDLSVDAVMEKIVGIMSQI